MNVVLGNVYIKRGYHPLAHGFHGPGGYAYRWFCPDCIRDGKPLSGAWGSKAVVTLRGAMHHQLVHTR